MSLSNKTIQTLRNKRRWALKAMLAAPLLAPLLSIGFAQQSFKTVSVTDLSARAPKAGQIGTQSSFYLLVFSTTGCPYCEVIRRSHLPNVPAQINGHQVLLQELLFDRATPMKDFDGQSTTYRDFSRRLGVRLSPTLIAFDEKGRQLGEALVGVANLDFYSFYLDQLVSKAAQLRTNRAQ